MGWLQDLIARFQPAKTTQGVNKNMAVLVGRITGGDTSTNKFRVAGTDLGIPYHDSNNKSRVNLIFGDSFSSPFPGGAPGQGTDWRSPVILTTPTPKEQTLQFDYAVGGANWAKECFYNAHDTRGLWNPPTEFTVIPNDAIWFPETGRQVMSWMSINKWDYPGGWRTGYASLAYTDNGQDWFRVPNLAWYNTENNQDPYQMWSMVRHNEWVYIISVKSGRQNGPMKLMRVPWDKMFDKAAYQLLGDVPGIPVGSYGEPSIQKIGNVFAMSYVNYTSYWWQGATLVTRTAPTPEGPWSAEKQQLSIGQEPNLYGGFIDPRSTGGDNGATFYVSRWSGNPTTHYHVSQYRGTF